MNSTWRFGVYDANRDLIHDSGELVFECGDLDIRLETPVDIPVGGSAYLRDHIGNWWPLITSAPYDLSVNHLVGYWPRA